MEFNLHRFAPIRGKEDVDGIFSAIGNATTVPLNT